ncbi:MAG: major facilitator superfamily 1 [Nevskia sp.]|nr:major facilitator superfamily 1 [Nevskia sp.]
MKARLFSGTTGKVFMLLCAMYFIEYVDRVNLSVAAPLLKKELSLTNTQLGLALSAFGYCYAMFQILGGYAGDRFGPRRTLAFSGVLWSIGTLLTGFVGGLGTLLMSRLLVGMGEAGTIPTATRAMSNWVPRVKRGFAQGFTHSSARAAAALTPPLVVAMIPLLGWRGAFIALGCVSLVWVVVWYSYFRDDPRQHRSITAGELADLPDYHQGRTVNVPVPWKPLIKRIMPVTLVFFCHAWTLWLYLSWLPSFFVGTYHIELKSSALYTSAVFFAGVVGDTVGGLLTDYLYRRTGDLNKSRRNVIIFGFAGSLSFLSCVMYFHDQTVVTLCLAAALFLLEMAEGPIWAVPIDVAPTFAGVAGGFVSTAAGVAAMVSPAAFGYITDLTGSYRPPFILSIGLLLIGIVLSFRIRADIPLQVPGVKVQPLDPAGEH